MTAAICTSNVLGVDFTKTLNISTATPEYPGGQFTLGMMADGVDGSRYMYVRANAAAIALGSACFVDINNNAVAILTSNAVAAAGQRVGVASQTAFAQLDDGWLQIDGICPALNVAASTTANTQLYSSTVAGVLTSTASGNSLVNGVVLTTANGGTQAAQPAMLNGPELVLTT